MQAMPMAISDTSLSEKTGKSIIEATVTPTEEIFKQLDLSFFRRSTFACKSAKLLI